MRVPVTQTNQSSNPKLINSGRNIGSFPITTPANIPNLCYEPTSVLDLRRSPSPGVADKTAASSTTDISATAVDVPSRPDQDPPLEWDEHVQHNLDWDSILRDLGLHDDSAPALLKNSSINPQSASCYNPQVPHVSEFLPSQPFDLSHLVHSDINMSELYNTNQISLVHNFNSFDLTHDFDDHHSNVGFEFVEDILRAADCFDSNELQLARAILDRLNQRLQSSTGKPLQRAAFYFKEALQSLLSGSNRTARLSTWPEIVHTIRAYKAFSAISPIPMFSHLTTNQGLLEALNGSSFIHVIDFDIGLGGQYASFMKEISEKSESRKLANPPFLRITAIVPEEYALESRLIRENLYQFGQDLKIRFQIDFVLLRTFETLSFKAVKFMDGEKTAILLTPTIFRRLGSTNSVSAFLADVRRVSASAVIFVDSEGWSDCGATSFKRNLVDSLEFYSMMLESLDAAASGGDWVRRIEAHVLRPKIFAAVEGAGRRETQPWREVFHGAGLRPLQLSQFADFQAECLLGKVQVRGFHVAKHHAELVLCWRERALVATSAWRC